jgi:hypothetical protein
MENSNVKNQRHWFVSLWLILIVASNILMGFIYLIFSDEIFSYLVHGISKPMHSLLVLICILNVFFAVLLWEWRKWGFWGFLCSTVVMFLANIKLEVELYKALTGMLSIVVLYLVLQIKQDGISAWSQLEDIQK